MRHRISMDRAKLKGGLETRRGGKVYDQYDNMVKDCGCKMGEKCGKMCKAVTVKPDAGRDS